jgi:collagen type VI alpha
MKQNFQKMLDFVEKIVQKYQVGQDNVLFSAVLFSSRSKVKFDFNKYQTTNSLLKAIKEIKYPYGGTRTELGLYDIRTKIFTAKGGHRAGVPQILIVMTDGNAQYASSTKSQADKVKAMGVNVFSLGIGQKIADSQLRALATDDSKVFRVTNFDQLVNFIGSLAEKTCKGRLKITGVVSYCCQQLVFRKRG